MRRRRTVYRRSPWLVVVSLGLAVFVGCLMDGILPTDAILTGVASVPSNQITTGTWGAAATTYMSAVQALSPTFYYQLNETGATLSGGTATNAGSSATAAKYGSGSNTSTTGCTKNDSPNTGVQFPALTSALKVGTTTAAIPSGVTIAVWAKVTGTSAYSSIVTFSDASPTTSKAVVLGLNNANAPFFYYTSGSGTAASLAGTTSSFTANTCHLLVATLSSSGSALYFDGTSVATKGSLYSEPSFSGNWYVGAINAASETVGASNPFPGTTDDVAIFPAVLTAAQVSTLYSAGG